jgi:hypothetical protein
MGTLTEKINNLAVGLFGNRVSALGLGIMIASHFYPAPNSIEHPVITGLYGITSTAGIMMYFYTGFGLPTLRIYKRTKQHIRDWKKLDHDFFIAYLGGDVRKPFTGYCQLQGMYLAARDTGHLEEFRELKRKYSKNLLPNF